MPKTERNNFLLRVPKAESWNDALQAVINNGKHGD
jgi:hypothetical protein